MLQLSMICIFFISKLFAAPSDFSTLAEQSNWQKTGRAEEAQRLCHKYAKAYPLRVKCLSYGMTPEKRSLPYMIIGNPKDPTVWVQAGIHAGEIDGKDAFFWLLKKVFLEGLKPDPFKGICVVFIPIVNLDGHERFGKWNRPNQVGPEEMGWRTTSQNYNLNRDFIKVDAPEMQSLLKLWHKIDPVLSLDLHVTNGAQFRPEVGLIIHPHSSFGSTPLHKLGTNLETLLLIKMKERGSVALPFYPAFQEEDNPKSGFSRHVSTARFAHGYWYNNHRLGILVESHSWKNYETRVRTHFNTILSSLELAQVYGKEWKKAEQEMGQVNLEGQEVELEYQHTNKATMIDFLGYRYEISKSNISGGDVIKYDPSKLENWKVPFFEEIKPSLVVKAPEKGYIIPSSIASLILPKLDTHDIKYNRKIPSDMSALQSFRATHTVFSPAPFEGHQTLVVEGEWQQESFELPKGSYFVPIHQPAGRMVLQLFEPKARDSFLSWGFFNRYFERKEYMEHYVAENVAMEMLKNPEIKKEFEEKLKSDKEFKANPHLRFEFFYKKHPSWDANYNRYPIYKI